MLAHTQNPIWQQTVKTVAKMALNASVSVIVPLPESSLQSQQKL